MGQKPTIHELRRLHELMKAIEHKRKFNKIEVWEPYPKQQEFLALGSTKRERLLIAGNQLGKSETGAYEAACHLTGIYPPDWKGHRFNRATHGWVAGETGTVVRDVQQAKLCGPPGVEEEFGSGMIPRECFVGKPTLIGRPSDAYDTVWIRHSSGGVSSAQFKSYEQGRTKFQGSTKDWIWFDEEPAQPIYTEGLARISSRADGIAWATYTPMFGSTWLTDRFTMEDHKSRGFVRMSAADAAHAAKRIDEIKSMYPQHEWDARIYGMPLKGSGRVFHASLEQITEAYIGALPLLWTKLWGVDFGIGHPFAAVLTAWDREADIIHVVHTIRMADALPIQHADAMRKIAALVPVSWPHDGHDRDKGSGEPLARQYKAQKLIMLPNHSQFEDGGNSFEAGIFEMDTRMRNGHLKVYDHLGDWHDEFHNYHRKDGKVVKEKDDLMSATRMAIMDKRFGRSVLLGGGVRRYRGATFSDGLPCATGIDFDPFQ